MNELLRLPRHMNRLAVALLLMLALPTALPAALRAQTGEIHVEGRIQALTSTTLTVGDVEFMLTDATELRSDLEVSLQWADLQVGWWVEVHGLRAPNATEYVARQVKVKTGSDDNGSDDNGSDDNGSDDNGSGDHDEEVEVTGLIEALTDTSITVVGQTFRVTNRTEVEVHGVDVPFSMLLVGVLVEVEGVYRDGVLYASEIEVKRRDAPGAVREVEFKGRITGLTDSTITVLEMTFTVTPLTVVMDDDRNVIRFSELMEGQVVEVKGLFYTERGVLVAVRIKVDDDDDNDLPGFTLLRVEGVIEALTDTSLTVGDTEYFTLPWTQVRDEDNRPIRFSELMPGQVVQVVGAFRGDSPVYALRIKVINDDDDEDTTEGIVETEGYVQARTDSSITVNTITFYLTAATVIKGDDRRLAPEDLIVGDYVEVRAKLGSDGLLYALYIKLEDDEREVEVVGRITGVDLEQRLIAIAGLQFYVPENAEIEDAYGRPLVLADLSAGMMAKVEGYVQGDGSLLAREIKVRVPVVANVNLTGTITEVGDGQMVVLGHTFHITAKTKIVKEGEGRVDPSALAAGQVVHVRGIMHADGTLIAQHIRILSLPQLEISIAGVIETIGADSLTVFGLTFHVDAATKVYGYDGSEISFADLAEGQYVRIKAELVAGIGLVARRIKQVEHLITTGTVSARASGRITLNAAAFAVDENTLVVNAAGEVIDLEQIAAGARVEVYAEVEASAEAGHTPAGTTTPTATKVVVLSDGTTLSTGTNGTDDLPTGFRLQQNYPNPFNPTTTIAFELTRAEASPVSLVVYNLLGQEVRTLIQGALPAGTYTVEWDGRDNAGAPVSSGVYLYRLTQGDQMQTRSMVLMK
ncbi:hypothetical protein AWN76_000260 [Rhodothermaceae bacterium RA]|nr:hypothetical protein AWN76_000260 [Rhodothermaceae bacterium RA]